MSCLHNLKAWPNGTGSASLLPLLISASRQQAVLEGRLREIGFSAAVDVARVDVLTEDAMQTSAIEGESLNFNSVRSSVGRRLGIETGLTLPEDLTITGLVDMLYDASQNCREPLTKERLFRWHAGMFPEGKSGFETIVTGAFRDGPIFVVSGPIAKEKIEYEAPGPERVEAEMDAFLKWFNAPNEESPGLINILVKAALSHLYFVSIHPFDDGNGRIGRAITDMLIARSDSLPGRFYSLSSQIAKERKDYYAALQAAQSGTMDVTAWVRWFLEVPGRAIRNSDAVVDRVMLKGRLWKRLEGYAVNDRQRKMIDLLCGDFDGKLTTEKWIKITKLTNKVTALRDIDFLIERGVLQKVDAGRNTSYELAPQKSPGPQRHF